MKETNINQLLILWLIEKRKKEKDKVSWKEVQKVLASPEATTKSGKVWFKKYNTATEGVLTVEELRSLIEDLNADVGLPPLNDDRLLDALFKKFDTNKNGVLEFNEFLNLYAAILRRVRDRWESLLCNDITKGAGQVGGTGWCNSNYARMEVGIGRKITPTQKKWGGRRTTPDFADHGGKPLRVEDRFMYILLVLFSLRRTDPLIYPLLVLTTIYG